MKIKTNEITVEWWSNLYGAEVFGAVVSVLKDYDLFHLDVPHVTNLAWSPDDSEAELCFTFQSAHVFTDNDVMSIRNRLRELKVNRLKSFTPDVY